MCIMINRIRFYSLITFIMTATMVLSSPQTFQVRKYGGPNGNKAPRNIQLFQGLNPGVVLSVIASSTGNSLSYYVNDVNRNRLINIQPRMAQRVISLNTFNDGWDTEETTSKLPIKNDEKYCLHIAYDSHGYYIFLNGEEVHFYKHRQGNNGTEFATDGTGKVFLMSYKLNEPKWAIQQTTNAVYIEEFGDDGIDTPLTIQLEGSNQLSTIAITGIISANATSVEFNLMNSDGEILFQFSPRFTDNVVAGNSYIDGIWDLEEIKNDAMVLQRNQRFTLAIDVEADYYKTYVNGEDYIKFEYRKRANNTNISKLYIPGDIKLFKIIYHK